MKINDIINEDEISERPVGAIRRAGLGLRSKLPGGSGARAKLDVGIDANEMKKDLQVWMDGSGISPKDLNLDDLKSFLTQKGLPNDKVDDIFSELRSTGSGSYRIGSLTNKEIDKILLKAVQQSFKSTGASGRKSRFAQRAATPPSSGSGAGVPSSISTAVSSLTPAQKAALKAML
jgi:hypothetical protein